MIHGKELAMALLFSYSKSGLPLTQYMTPTKVLISTVAHVAAIRRCLTKPMPTANVNPDVAASAGTMTIRMICVIRLCHSPR